ncbi:MAG: LytTR family transcriptional regulator DNA-binding domain-containing protein [Clostridia bacterium]|nr:LytTR family transcriptional regulator DNA-binding domain-containing protein [Clostridia bacterium]
MDDSKAKETKRIKIEIDPEGPEEIVIRCRKLTPEVLGIQALLEGAASGVKTAGRLSLRLGDEEHLIEPRRILFFEATEGRVAAHTDKRIFYTDMKLYELEAILPASFMRVSKACILNLDAVSWLRRELTGLCRVGFASSPIQIYISRMYYKPFREKLEETRMLLK